MIKLPSTRTFISIALMVVFLFFLVAILFITNLSFSVWEHFQQTQDWVIWIYLSVILLASILFGRIVWRLLMPKGKKSAQKRKSSASVDNMQAVAQRLEQLSRQKSPLTKESSKTEANKEAIPDTTQNNDASTESDLNQNDASFDEEETSQAQSSNKKSQTETEQTWNLDEKWASEFEASTEVAAIRAELEEYGRRKEEQTLYIALFGDISCGKSSLIKALIADAEDTSEQAHEQIIETSVIGGTTREICHYQWAVGNNKAEQHYILTDMPGLNEQFAELDVLSTEEVQRAHIAIYLCDGDLTATQFTELSEILLINKPCVIAINKSDRYSRDDLLLIINRIQARIETVMQNVAEKVKPEVPVLTISAGGVRELIRVLPDGEEERVQRPIKPDVEALQKQLQSMMQHYGMDKLEKLREKTVASMVNNKLDELDVRFKNSQSRRMVKDYTKKAVVVALATISPGTDILVQGYLGIKMIKDLCKLYDVPASDIDANKLIELIQSRMDKTLPLLLAIAGNGFKAFPGVGTVTGGLMHAVAYGMIFDTLGRSVARTLEVTGELSPKLVSDLYKEQLSENIESRTKDFIKLVLKLRKGD